MKFMLPTTTMLFALVASVVATPIHIARDVYDPHITSPNANTVWIVNTTQTVTWDTSNPPAQITNPIGSILLRKDGFTFLTLASGFDILLGKFEVTVPDVTKSSKYIVVLMGDSGNFSPEFTITGGTSA
ncbi:hypothetical protein EDD18DRAFT_742501 [Armillaria luteobubalina]|uniref:Uncharacterized protein n=1 Tax=Armillaria luteobubalina TaxID=153913 RepID=A0AA39QEU2_9AGAR|nr:hypothetical protein EDD18DRAFT_742501 [Armillaria luteobubalina]